jgi:Flp pilus assembly protein TadD
VTTTSPEAYRSYLEGVELSAKYFSTEAKAAFKHAIELDSNFAMAYVGLATLAIETDAEMQRRALMKALSLSERTTEKERLAIQSLYALRIEADPAKGHRILEDEVAKYPREQGAYRSLAQSYRLHGEFDKAIQIAKKGLQNDERDGELWNGLGYTYASIGQKENAIAAIDRYVQISPALPNPYDSKGEIYAMFGERDSALANYQKAMSFKSDFPSILKIGLIALIRMDYVTAERDIRRYGDTSDSLQAAIAKASLTAIPYRRGRLQEAELLLRRSLEWFQARQLQDQIRDIYAELAVIAYLRQDFATMLEYAQKLAPGSDQSPARMVFIKGFRALAELKNGNTGRYMKISSELADTFSALPPRARPAVEYVLGTGLYEQGKFAEALEHFSKMAALLGPNYLPPIQQAVALLKTGRTDDAAASLKKIAAWVPVDVDAYTLSYFPLLEDALIASVKAHYWLGVAYEKQGDRSQARKEYGSLLELWKDADFRPIELVDGTARLSALKRSTAP